MSNAINPNLIPYRVMLHEEQGDKFQIAFDCHADDDDHAEEQAENAYPNCEIISILSFGHEQLPTPVSTGQDNTTLIGEVGKHDWCIGERCEDGYLVFVDDRQLSYRATLELAREFAMDIIANLQADGDYRLNDRPSGFLPPKRKQAASKVNGLKLIEVSGRRYEWNETFGSYWSVDGDPRVLQKTDLIEKAFNGWTVSNSSSVSAQEILKLGFELKDHRLYPDDLATIKQLLAEAGYSAIDVSMPGTTSLKGLPSRVVSIKKQ